MMKKDARQEMSVFLERQSVRRRRVITRNLRRAERVLLSVAVVLVGLAALYALYGVILWGGAFAVNTIVVDGEWRSLTAQGIAELSGVKEGDGLFGVSVEDVHRRLRSEPWVKATAVGRRLPHTLWIYVEEYRPAAIAVAEHGFFYVDGEGRPFKRLEAGDDRDLPVLTGIALKANGEADEGTVARIREMLSLGALFRASEFGRTLDIAEIHFDRIAGYSVIAGTEPVQVLFGHAAFAEAMAALDRMAPAIRERLPAGRQGAGRIQYMLADRPGRIIVKYHDSA